MLKHEENEMLTRVGPGTPMGELIRRYWIPAAFSHQIPDCDGPPVRVRLMCEDLVLFRDTQGRLGLLEERCPHRTASLFTDAMKRAVCAASIMASNSTFTAIAPTFPAFPRRATRSGPARRWN